MKPFIAYLCLLIPLLLSCQSGKTTTKQTQTSTRQPLFTPGSRTIVYKTTGEYARHVPVTMNKERTRIVSYPAPADIYHNGQLAFPTPLADGFWLDNRGIGPHSVFLDYTYEEYARLDTVLSAEALMKHILDKYPFTQMWDCGTRIRSVNEQDELKKVIRNGFLECKKIEITPIIFQKDPDYSK